jgi:hypothetical protein
VFSADVAAADSTAVERDSSRVDLFPSVSAAAGRIPNRPSHLLHARIGAADRVLERWTERNRDGLLVVRLRQLSTLPTIVDELAADRSVGEAAGESDANDSAWEELVGELTLPTFYRRSRH